MAKLKGLLEGYAWERKDGQSLPTMQEVLAKYEQNLYDKSGLQYDESVIEAFNHVIKHYRMAVKGLSDEQTYEVSQQLAQFFS